MPIPRATSRESVATRRRHRASVLRICVCLGALALSGCNGPVEEPDTLSPTTESAARIKVITSGGFTAAFDILGPLFEQATGIEIETQYGSSMGGGPTSIPVRLAEGEVADVLIFNDRAFDDLAAAGYLQPDTRVDLANSIIGMSVRSGAPKPDISTLEAFIETLRSAESFGYSASVSGTHLSTVALPSLGIWEEIESKSRRVVTERVASVVARGEVELGFQAVSEILSIEGADYVGPIPDEIQQTSSFLAVIPANTENADRRSPTDRIPLVARRSRDRCVYRAQPQLKPGFRQPADIRIGQAIKDHYVRRFYRRIRYPRSDIRARHGHCDHDRIWFFDGRRSGIDPGASRGWRDGGHGHSQQATAR